MIKCPICGKSSEIGLHLMNAIEYPCGTMEFDRFKHIYNFQRNFQRSEECMSRCYKIGYIIKIPNDSIVKVLDVNWDHTWPYYTLERLADRKGFQVYKNVKYLKRGLIQGLEVLKEAPIPKMNWLAYKKNTKFQLLIRQFVNNELK